MPKLKYEDYMAACDGDLCPTDDCTTVGYRWVQAAQAQGAYQ